jgi:hypothetical protein
MSVTVTLVHGTWNPSADWARADSLLCQAISRGLGSDVSFHTFRWSGHNRVSARSEASARLSEHLIGLVRDRPEARHFIIAHSHGGNIAFHALRNRCIASNIAGVVCLSTPFLHVRGRPFDQMSRNALIFPFVFFLPVAVAYLISRFCCGGHWLPILVLSFFGMIGAAGYSGAADEEAARLGRLLKHGRTDPQKVLIIRTSADEAGNALGIVSVLNWLLTVLWQRWSVILTAGVSAIGAAAAPLAALWGTNGIRVVGAVCVASLTLATVIPDGSLHPAADPFLWILGGAALALLVLPLATAALMFALGLLVIVTLATSSLILFILLGIATLPFGFGLALHCPFLEVSAESTPRGRWTVHHFGGTPAAAAWTYPTFDAPIKDVLTSLRSVSLAHSTAYRDPRVIECIAQWIAYKALAGESRINVGRITVR